MDSEEIEVIESESELQEPVVAKKSSKKRMNSITRRLHWQLVRSKMGIYFVQNLLIFGIMCGGWAYMQESHSDAGFDIDRIRTVYYDRDKEALEYQVLDTDQK